MNVIETELKGLLILQPRFFSDTRGMFYESWRQKDYAQLGIQEIFVQDNISVSQKNVLRGLHHQKNQGQLVWVSFGKIFYVVVDMRENSKTFRNHFSLEMSSELPRQIYAPPGFFHGFCVLSDMAVVNYKCTQYYNPFDEAGMLWNDPALNIPWPIQDAIISQRDLSYIPVEVSV